MSVQTFGPFRLIASERLLERDGAAVTIGGRTLDLLIALTERPGAVLSVRELLSMVWPDVTVEEANLRVCVAALRKVIGDGKEGARYVVNVPGRGYAFVAPIQSDTDGSVHAGKAGSALQSLSLPPIPQLLVGRSDTVEVLALLLLTQRFVSVVGPGGIGKTTVSLAVANVLRSEFGDDGICFVDGGSVSEPGDLPNAVASALGCFVQGLDPVPAICAFLDEKRILIILDSCEHVIEAAASLSEHLFHEAKLAHLLTTSREALRVDGENVHLLQPLLCPRGEMPSADQALATPAVQLFMEKAAASGHRESLSDEDAPIVASICRRLNGVALAIELVASRVGTYGIHGTADLLDDGAELVLQGRRDALPRHQTLQALHDWSYRLLTVDEQKVLARLSVFVGELTLAAAHAVAGDAADDRTAIAQAIAGLVDKSLLQIASTQGPARYRLLDTTRSYAANKLAERQEADEVAKRHALYFTSFLEQAKIQGSAFDGRSVAHLASSMGNIRRAMAWSFSPAGDVSIGVRLTAHAAHLSLGLSLLGECQQWCHRALATLREDERETLLELELQEALAMSIMYTRGNGEEAKSAVERGLNLAEVLQDTRRQFQMLTGLFTFDARRGDFHAALAVARRSAVLANGDSDKTENAVSEWMLGVAYHFVGDQAAALNHSQRGFAHIAEPRHPGFFGYGLHVSGVVVLAQSLWLCGFPDQSYKVAREGLNSADGYDHPVSRCILMLYLIQVLHWSGHLQTAQKYTDAVLDLAERFGLAPHHAAGLSLKGEITTALGDPSAGVQMVKQALRAMDANQYHIATFSTRRALAEGLALTGQHGEAAAVIDDAVGRAEELGQKKWLPDILRTQGDVLLSQSSPDFEGAETAYLGAIDTARQQSALSWELKAAIPLARMWNGRGKNDEARSLLKGLTARFSEGFGTPDLIAAHRLLGMSASLPRTAQG